MTFIRLVLLALLGGSACVALEEPLDGGPGPGDPAQGVTAAQLAVGPPEVCDLLPTEGACRHACDADALAMHVPSGTCAVFYCELLDGRAISVHACHE
jgi:hypothetical protein